MSTLAHSALAPTGRLLRASKLGITAIALLKQLKQLKPPVLVFPGPCAAQEISVSQSYDASGAPESLILFKLFKQSYRRDA